MHAIIRLVITMCLATDPDVCHEQPIPIPDLTDLACTMKGEEMAMEYLEDHPKWRLRRWTCARAVPSTDL